MRPAVLGTGELSGDGKGLGRDALPGVFPEEVHRRAISPDSAIVSPSSKPRDRAAQRWQYQLAFSSGAAMFTSAIVPPYWSVFSSPQQSHLPISPSGRLPSHSRIGMFRVLTESLLCSRPSTDGVMLGSAMGGHISFG